MRGCGMKIPGRLIGLCTLSAALFGSLIMPLPKPTAETDGTLSEAVSEWSSAVPHGEKFEILEGLPHFFEGKEFVENERLTKATVNVDGEWFYAATQPFPARDVAELQRLVAGGLLQPWRGMKLCGGFHADYAIRFDSGGNVYHLLFCLGCHEARITRDPQDATARAAAVRSRITADLSEAQYKELQILLRKYRKERPPTPPRTPAKKEPEGPPPVPVRL